MITGSATRGLGPRAGLWISLAANLFLMALVGAHLLRTADRPDPPPRTLDGAIERIAAALPADDARRFRAVMLQQRPHYQPAHDRMEQARQAFARAISRNPYDEQATQDAMHTWQTDWNDFMRKFGDSFLRAAGALSSDGRTKLAEFAEHRTPDHRR